MHFRYENCFLARTDPKDVARVESRTVISTPQKLESIPPAAEGVKGTLGNWMSPRDLDAKVQELFPGCMEGKLYIQRYYSRAVMTQSFRKMPT